MDAVFIRTHTYNKRILDNIKKLAHLAEHVFVVYDQTDRQPFPEIGVPVIPFTIEDYENSGYPVATLEQVYELPTPPPLGSRSAAIYYNPEYAQLLAMKKLDEQGKKYDNYWYYEYDVIYNGNIRQFFSTCKNSDADLLTTHLRQFPFDPTFQKFWDMISFDINERQQFAMFGPLWRASRKFMEVLDSEYKAGKHGYYETIVPTLAVINDLSIADINSLGMLYNPFTFNGLSVTKYWSQKFLNNMKNMLFHPVRQFNSTFLFATGYLSDNKDIDKYLKWIDYYWKNRIKLGIENIVIIDDGSKIAKVNMLEFHVQQSSVNFAIVDYDKLPDDLCDGVTWVRFPDNLGRPSIHATPGWHRSFSFAAVMAEYYNYDKIIHIEADTFVLTDRLFRYLYDTNKGWSVLWSHKYAFPDTCIQMIMKDKFKDVAYMYHLGEKFWFKAKTNKWFIAEFILKFTDVVKYFEGGRYEDDPFLCNSNGADYISDYTLDEKQKMNSEEIVESPKDQQIIIPKTKKKLADIIIPHHDKHELLKNCISKIDNNLFNVIIVSGGSYGENCNAGAKAAKTDTLLFLNDDVVPDNNILAEVALHKTDLTGCAQYIPSEGLTKYGIAYNIKDGKAQGYLALRPEDCLIPTGFCFKIKKKVWDDLGGFDERFKNGAEDQDLGLKALERGISIGYVTRAMKHYHSQSSGRFDHTKENNKLLKQIWTDERIFKLMKNNQKKLKILVANHHLSELAGSETFTITLYNELQKMGHIVDLYAYKKSNVKLAKTIDEPKDEYDLILLSHNTCMEKFRHYRGVKICTVHGTTPRLEQPRTGADLYVSISEEIQSFMDSKGFKSEIIYNGIDSERFQPKKAINVDLKNVLSLCKTDEANIFIKRVCSKLGLNFKAIKNQPNVEDYINEADLVVSLGRGVYESLSCGRAVVVYDNRGYQEAYSDGYLTKSKLDESLQCNYSGRKFKRILTEKDFIEELSKYQQYHGEENYQYAQKFTAKLQAEKYIELYEKYINKHPDFEFVDSSSTDYGIARQLQRQLKAMGHKEGGGKTICYGNDMGIINIQQQLATVKNSATMRRYVESQAEIKLKSQNLDLPGHHLPSAIDNNIFYDKKLVRDVDLSFVSKISNDKRRDFVQLLKKEFPKFVVRDDIYFDGMSDLYNRTKIVPNHSVVKEINMRMFEATACGALLITEFVNDLPKLWNVGTEIITFKTYSEMIELIRYYLAHPDEREKIAKAGQMRTLKEHTYYNRCLTIEKLLGEDNEKHI